LKEPNVRIPRRTFLQAAAAGGAAYLGTGAAGGQDAPAADIVAPGAKVELLAKEFKFTEGPAADAAGNVYFTDQPNDRICLWTVAKRELTTWMQPCGRSNGLYFDKAGNLLACADDKNQLWSISPAKEVAVLVKDYQGKLLNGPNDLWPRPDGGIYFTDPYYKRPYWDRGPPEQDVQAVYFLAPDRKTLSRVAADLTQPNGIIGTPDGRTLYVADIGAKKTYAYEPQADGSLAGKRLFCEMGSDGMTIDERGNVYLTGKGVTVFDPAGRKIAHLDVPDQGWTANVTFGCADRRTLFITAGTGFYGIQMAVKGA
jgi:gluconolactonase